MKVGEFY